VVGEAALSPSMVELAVLEEEAMERTIVSLPEIAP
jgi:hypothetical protein